MIIYMQSLYVRNCIMHVMVIERIIATLKSRNYEKHTSILFHIIWITITVTAFNSPNLISSYTMYIKNPDLIFMV